MAVHDEPPSGKSFDPGRFDPCHNPADAWPIIVGSKINIRFGAEGMACEAQFMQYGHESVECYHANPLRAAMIVFLMMQDANNA
ncbi:phage protein NinX family protein [Enterobacter kobei]|uniref:phage protein NinX family protein n=1 Tax=Enterobacter kobei TaxID=208224 RepID=UPI0039C0645F